MKLYKLLIISMLMSLFALPGYAQLSDLHYLPPLKQRGEAIVNQAIYLSTPEATAFDVKVYQGNSTTILETLTISSSAGLKYDLSNGDNNITFVTDANTGIVLMNSGLRLESAGGQKFYVNYRGKSTYQATSLTSKGRSALGTSFKWGGVPNRGTTYSLLNAALGIMATEDNTKVRIFGYDPNCTFRQGANAEGITADDLDITLNAGESYVLEAIISAAGSPNVDGWLGASIQADKKIAVFVGELHFQPSAIDNQDCGIDQIIPENTLGKEYVFVRGNGIDAVEFPVIIATQNGTEIFVNGAATPIATINNGDYFEIPSSYYSTSSTTASVPGGNMYVYTTHEAYAFQSLAGDVVTATGDINFVAPVNCLLSNQVDFIPDITNMAGTTISGGVTILASTAIAEQDLIVKYGTNQQVSVSTLTAAKQTLLGSTNWKTYYLPGLTGNVTVNANGPIAVGFFGFNGSAGASGYFSGFESIPTIEVTKTADGCLPSTILTATAGFSAYSWYRDKVLISGATSNSYSPSLAGNYTVEVTNGSCTYESSFAPVYDCNPELVWSVTADNRIVQSGSTVTFTVKAQYFGYTPVTNVLVSNVLPGIVTYTGNSPTFGSYNAGTGVWTIGTMYPGEEHILTVTATVNSVASPTDGTYTISNTQTFSVGSTEGNKITDDLTEVITAVATLLDPGLNNFLISNKTYYNSDFEIPRPFTMSTGGITYTSSNPQVATISGNIATIKGSGTSSIMASQAADLTYYSGTIATTLTVTDVPVITKYGRLANNLPNYVSKNGGLNAMTTLSSNGAIITAINLPIITSGLIMYLDAGNPTSYSGTGPTWTDISGNGNHGTLENGVGYTSVNSGALVFDGVNDYFVTNNNFNLSSTDKLTVQIILKTTSTRSEMIMEHSVNWNNNNSYGVIINNLNDKVQFVDKNQGYNARNSAATINDNNWCLFSATTDRSLNATNQSLIYIDGDAPSSVIVPTLANDNSGNFASHKLYIASRAGSSFYFKGNIAQVFIYNRALTALEIQQNYNAVKSRYGL